jgi:hypothetical protein
MPQLQNISLSPIAGPAAADIKLPPAPEPAKQEKPKAPVEIAEHRFDIKRYTARYRMEGDRLNIQILDSEGRLVRTVPPNELLKALQGEFSRPRVDWQG